MKSIAEEQYRAIFEQSGEGIFIADAEGNYLDANPAACKLLGYTREEILRMSIADVITEDETERIAPEIEAGRRDGSIHNHWIFRRKDGSVFIGEVSGIKLSDGRLQAVVNNVTAYMQQREILTKDDDHTRLTLDNMLEGCQIIGYDWRYLYINQASELQNRRPKEELLGKRMMDMWPGIEDTQVYRVIKKAIEERVPSHAEELFVFPDGTKGWFDVSIQPVPEGVLIFSVDITEHKQAEQDLLENEEKYRFVTENADDWIYWVSPQGRILYISPACEWITGYSAQEFMERPSLYMEIVVPEDKEMVHAHNMESIKGDISPHSLIFRIINKKGELCWIDHNCTALFTEGEYKGLVGTNRNITALKQAEERLYESELKFRKIFEDGPFGMALVDKDFRIITANTQLCNMLGFSEAELQQRTFRDISSPKELKNDVTQIKKLIGKEISIYKTEKRYIRSDGQTIWGSLTVTPNFSDDGHFLYNLAIIEDVTRRKQVEEALQVATERLELATDVSNVGIWDMDLVKNTVYWDDNIYEIYGFDPEKDSASNQRWLDSVHPDDLEELHRTLAEVNSSKNKYDLEFRIIRPDGEIRWIGAVGEVFRDSEGKPVRMVGVNYDITSRKQAEEALQLATERLELATNVSNAGIWDFDLKKNTVYWDNKIYEIYGLDREQHPASYQTWQQTVHPDDAENMNRLMEHLFSTLTYYNLEFRIVRPDGAVRWIGAVGEIFRDHQDKPVRMIGVNNDITNRKQAEAELYASKKQLETAIDSMTDAIVITDAKGQFVQFNEAFATFHKFKSKEECYSFLVDYMENFEAYYLDGNLIPIDQWPLPRALKGETGRNFEIIIHRKDIDLRWMASLSYAPIRDANGQIAGAVMAGRDITKRKQAEEELYASKQKLETAIESMTDAVVISDTSGRFVQFNEAFATFHKFKSKEECLRTFEEYPETFEAFYTDGSIAPVDQWALPKALRGETGKNTEYILRRTDTGESWIVSYSFAPICDAKGQITGAVLAGRDITESKKAEEALRISEERYRNIYESAVIGIYRTTPDGKILMANPTLVKLLGFDSLEELTRRNLEEEGFEGKASRNEFRLKLEKEGKVTGLESEWKTKDGRSVYVSENARAFYNDRGKIIYYEGTIEDITERKLMERNLRESEERFRKAFQINPDSISISKLEDGIFITVNNGFTQIFGYTQDEVKGKSSFQLDMWVNPEDRNKYVNDFREKGIVENLELQLKTKEGKIIDTLLSAVVINAEGDHHLLTTIKDMTAYKRAQETVRKHEALLNEMGRIAQIGAWEYYPHTGQVIWTDEVARIHDLDPIPGVPVNTGISYYYGESVDIITKAVREAVEEAKPYDLELEILTAKGVRKWVRSIGNPVVEDGKVVRITGSVQDVTKRKNAEDALRRSEENFRSLIESISLPVAYINQQGVIVFRNAKFYEVFGYTEEEVPTVKEWWINAFPDNEYRQMVINNWALFVQRAKETGKDTVSAEYDITCKDGSVRTIVTSGVIINNNILITLIDITDRKRAEEEVKKLNETLEKRVEERTFQLMEANRELEAFSYSVSHDLRAPLRHINGFVDLLNQKYNDLLPDKGKHYLSTIVESSKHMGTLIDDLLQFSRTGRQEMQHTRLDMGAVVGEVLKLMAPDIQERSIDWRIAPLPAVTGDQALLRMVWYNLLSNAVKFTKNREKAIIEIGTMEEDAEIVFFVRDNGAGFDMKYVHKLFGVFQRLHSKADFEGTGIGLANVRRIIQKHGGRTWAESQSGEGATFYFTLPK